MFAEPELDFHEGADGQVRTEAGLGLGAGQEERLTEAGGVCGSDVGAAVSDEEAFGEIEVEVMSGT